MVSGREAIVQEMRNMKSADDRTNAATPTLRTFKRRHFVSNFVVRIDGDRATAPSLLFEFNSDNSDRRPCVGAYGHLEAGVTPRAHKVLEPTELMLQMVAGNRGVAALSRWLVEEHRHKMAIAPVRLGRQGVSRQIHLGLRATDADTAYLSAFVALARKKRA